MKQIKIEKLTIAEANDLLDVDMEPGFTDDLNPDFITSCFDLSAFIGEEVALEFTFGSDSSVTYPGWYLASVMVGANVVGVEAKSLTDVTFHGAFRW